MEKELFAEVEKRFYEARFIKELGIELVSVAPGEARSKLTVQGSHLQQDGFVHAGVVATLADHTGGASAWTLVHTGQTVLTVEFKVQLLNPARGPVLSCHARVMRAGKKIAFSEAEVTNADGALAAKLTMTLAIVETGRLRSC